MTLSQIIKQQEKEFDRNYPYWESASDSTGNLIKAHLSSSIRLACVEMGRVVEEVGQTEDVAYKTSGNPKSEFHQGFQAAITDLSQSISNFLRE